MAGEMLGTVREIGRYPVRSMRGERLESAEVGKLGLVGDRAFGVVPGDAFEVASASKSPKRWGELLRFEATYVEAPRLGAPPPPVELRHESGKALRSDAPGFDAELSVLLGREVTLRPGETDGALATARARKRAEEAGDPSAAPAVAYASAPVHLLTTASLAAIASLYPEGRFAPERFRPNLLVDTGDAEGFVEAGWVGRALRIGEVVLDVFLECERCGMTTVAQAGLPRDPGVLRAIAEHHRTNLGVVAGVARPGTLRLGDAVRWADPV